MPPSQLDEKALGGRGLRWKTPRTADGFYIELLEVSSGQPTPATVSAALGTALRQGSFPSRSSRGKHPASDARDASHCSARLAGDSWTSITSCGGNAAADGVGAVSATQFVTAIAVCDERHFLGWVVVKQRTLFSPPGLGRQSRPPVMAMRSRTSQALRKYLPAADAVGAGIWLWAGKDTR